jgi:hypothetical protein
MILLIISKGTPNLADACVAACLRKSFGRKWMPTIFPAFNTIILAASYEIEKL